MANTIESIEITNPFGVVDTTAKVTVTAQDYLSLEAIEEAGEHTLQMWVKADSAKTITFIQNENKKFAVNTSWTRIVWTFNADVSEVLVLLPIGTYYFYNTKIEKGNIDTDYTRAPEDTDKEITELVTKYSEVKQTVDGITTTVGKHTTEISDLGTKVTATETVANQTAEQFKWIVKSGTSETDFTLTDRTASLVSEYINLNGLVTFSGLNSETQNKINGGIASVDVMYAQSTSNTTAPTSGWTTTAPAWKDGYYMWQKTVTTYKDGTSVETSATVLTGATGQNGKDGKDGTSVTILGSYDTEDELNSVHPTGNIGDAYMVSGDLYVWNGSAWQNVGQIKGDTGATGVGVLAITEQYYLSTSNTGQAGGSWSTDEPEWKSGCYIWTRSKIDYDNETTSYTTPVLAKAINGANTNASNAVSTANTASTNASNALTTAGTANATASQAKVDASNAVSTANSASSTANSALEIAESIDDTISEWCYENDRTIINGGKIATGTIAAEAIKAKAITADKIYVEDLGALKATIGGFGIADGYLWASKVLDDNYKTQLRLRTPKLITDSLFSIQKGKTEGENPSEYEYVFRITADGWLWMDKGSIHCENNAWINGFIESEKYIWSKEGIRTDSNIKSKGSIITDSMMKCVGTNEVLVSGGASNIIMHNNYDRKIYLRLDGSYFYITPHTSSGGFDTAHAMYMSPTTGAVSVASITNRSSKRFKENVSDITDDVANRLLDVDIVHFDYKPEYGDKDMYGVIAEDVINVHPNAVIVGADGLPEGVDYTRFIPLLIKKIQMQEKQINELTEKVNKLINQN